MATVILVRGTQESGYYSDRITAAMASTAMQRFQKRVMILQTSTRLPVETIMLGSRLDAGNISTEVMSFTDTGMDALMRRVAMGPLSHEQFSDCCINIAKNMNGFDIAGVSQMPNAEAYFLENFNLFKELLKNASSIYDVIFILADVKGEDESKRSLVEKLEEIVNQEVVCVPQGPKVEFKAGKDAFLAVKNYDALSFFTAKAMSKAYGNKNVFPVPYNILFKDACLKKFAISFLYRNTTPETYDDNSYFAESVANLVGALTGMDEPHLKERMFVYRLDTTLRAQRVPLRKE